MRGSPAWRCSVCNVGQGVAHLSHCPNRPCPECTHPVGGHKPNGQFYVCGQCGCHGPAGLVVPSQAFPTLSTMLAQQSSPPGQEVATHEASAPIQGETWLRLTCNREVPVKLPNPPPIGTPLPMENCGGVFEMAVRDMAVQGSKFHCPKCRRDLSGGMNGRADGDKIGLLAKVLQAISTGAWVQRVKFEIVHKGV